MSRDLDHYRRSLLNTFSASPIDRSFERRREIEWLHTVAREAATGHYVFHGDQCLIDAQGGQPVTLGGDVLAREIEEAIVEVFLGQKGGQACFALELDDDHAAALVERLPHSAGFAELRASSPRLDPAEASVLAYAKAMLHWHRGHRFCGACGAPTRAVEGGHVRHCSGPGCRRQHFPRTDPAVIMAVTHGERCLMGRQQRWPPGQYSVLAGFVEPGEPLEMSVMREVREEAGIELAEVHYHSSQPWPFPGSIMLGFTARATSDDIELHDGELADARWFTRDMLVEEVMAGRVRVPTRISIAYRLLEDWFDAGSAGALAEVAARGRPWKPVTS